MNVFNMHDQNHKRQIHGALFLLVVAYYTFIAIFYGGAFNPSIEWEYQIGAEGVSRLLFGGDVKGLADYCVDIRGESTVMCELGPKLLMSVTVFERPLFFLYLAAIKQFDPYTVQLHAVISVILIAASCFLVAKSLRPENPAMLFLLAALLVTPFYFYQSINQQPHIPELFLSSLGLFFYVRKQLTAAFYVLFLSIAFHPGNLVLFGSFGLLFLYDYRINARQYFLVALGIVAAIGTIEFYQFILFMRDTLNLMPHEYFIEKLIFNSNRVAGEFARSADGAGYWKNSFVFLPLSTIGLFWVRTRTQFFICLLPILVYFVATKSSMPGVHRVLLPVYFFGLLYFFHHVLDVRNYAVRAVMWAGVACVASLTVSYHYLAVTAEGLDTTEPFQVMRGDADYSQLKWNMERVATLSDPAVFEYTIEKAPVTQKPNIISPFNVYPYIVVNIMNFVLPNAIYKNIVQGKGWDEQGALRFERRAVSD